MHDTYILRGTEAIPEPDLLTWARWFETAERQVARTELAEGISVSTVFLSLDHQWGHGPPILYETMVFGGPLHEEQEQYHTWQEAEEGHQEMVARVRLALAAPPQHA